MTFKIRGTLSLVLAAVFILAACAPAPAPTVPATPDLSQIATDVAATIFAGQTATAAAQPTFTPTVFVPTETPIIPTATPFVIVTSTSSGSSGGGGSTTKPAYACDIIRQRPFDNSTFHPGDDFDVKWTIINTGTATWPAGTDFKYFSGPKMVGQSFLELPQMKPGAQYAVHWDASAPDAKGFQVMTWIVQGGFCYPYVAIVVE